MLVLPMLLEVFYPPVHKASLGDPRLLVMVFFFVELAPTCPKEVLCALN
jgi:hypothetical protein